MRSGDPQIRRNVATALAILGTRESLSRLISVALSDKDEAVRQHAERELVRLDGEPRATVAELLSSTVHTADTGESAYGLLGRLRGAGWSEGSVAGPTLWRLKMAAALRRAVVSNAGFKRRFAMIWPALLGAGAGLLILIALLFRVYATVEGEDISWNLFAGFGLAAALAVTAAGGNVALRLYPDYAAAMVIQVGKAAFYGTVIGIVLLLLINMFDGSPPEGVSALGFVAGVGAMAAASRVGAAVAVGVLPAVRLNRYAQVVTGSLFGVIAMTALFVLAGATDGTAAASWGPLVIACVGLSNAFARIDERSPRPLGRTTGLSIVGFSVAAVALVALAVAVNPFRWGSNANQAVSEVTDLALLELPSTRSTFSFPVPTRAAELPLTIKTPQSVTLTFTNIGLPPEDLAMLVYTAGETGVAQPEHAWQDDPDPPTMTTTLQPGNYRVIAGPLSAIRPARQTDGGQRFVRTSVQFSPVSSSVELADMAATLLSSTRALKIAGGRELLVSANAP
jgi:hypothetical protein